MNSKQTNFLAGIQNHAYYSSVLYSRAFTFREQFQEDFIAGKTNDISIEDLSQYGFTYTNVLSYVNQNLLQYQNFWTNKSVGTAEYGKFARAVMSNDRLVII